MALPHIYTSDKAVPHSDCKSSARKTLEGSSHWESLLFGDLKQPMMLTKSPHWFLSLLENTIFTLFCSLRLCTLLLQRPTHPGYPRAAPEVKFHESSSCGGTHKLVLYAADGGTNSFPCMTISLA